LLRQDEQDKLCKVAIQLQDAKPVKPYLVLRTSAQTSGSQFFGEQIGEDAHDRALTQLDIAHRHP